MFFRTFSGILFALFVALCLLQLIPFTGVFLMVLGGAFWTGLLVHFFLLALAIEAFLRRVPRELLLVPVLAYGGYYAMYAFETFRIAQTTAELRSANSGKVFDFNADSHSLVTPVAQAFVQTHVIPVVYASDPYAVPERYVSFRLMPRNECNIGRDSQNRIQQWGVSSRIWSGSNKPCLLRYPQVPTREVVLVAKIGDEEIWKRKTDISTQTSQLIVGGKILGMYKTASIWRLPVFPFLVIGCGLNSGQARWQCTADFWRTHAALDTVPDGIDRQRFDGPESVMLGIPKYSAAEFSDFRPHAQNSAMYATLLDEPKRVEDRTFAQLRELVDGGSPDVPPNFGYTLSQDPARLMPFAEAMANRFIELANVLGGQEYLYQYEGLATALKALPDDTLARVALPLRLHYVEVSSRNEAERFRDLNARILRLSGPTPPDFLENEFMTTRGYRRLFPVLAMCRTGAASPTVIERMKSLLLEESSAPATNDDIKTALIVTLIKLGEARYVADERSQLFTNAQPDFGGWLDAVLAGKGATDVGPNNCMTRNWNGRRAGKPSLKLMHGKWMVPS